MNLIKQHFIKKQSGDVAPSVSNFGTRWSWVARPYPVNNDDVKKSKIFCTSQRAEPQIPARLAPSTVSVQTVTATLLLFRKSSQRKKKQDTFLATGIWKPYRMFRRFNNFKSAATFTMFCCISRFKARWGYQQLRNEDSENRKMLLFYGLYVTVILTWHPHSKWED